MTNRHVYWYVLCSLLIALAGCQAFKPVPLPAQDDPYIVMATVFTEIKGAYIAAIDANTPAMPGEKALISNERFKQIVGQLDAVKARTDAVYTALKVGRWDGTDPQSILNALHAIRVTIPLGG